MSNTKEIVDRIYNADGVIALVVLFPNGDVHERAALTPSSAVRDLHDAIRFSQRTLMDTMVSAASERKIIIRRHDGIVFAVEISVGHQVNKSIERMLRRSAKRLAPPPATEAVGS